MKPPLLAKRNPRLPVYRPVVGPGREPAWQRGTSLSQAGITMDEAIEFFDDPEGGLEDEPVEDQYESD